MRFRRHRVKMAGERRRGRVQVRVVGLVLPVLLGLLVGVCLVGSSGCAGTGSLREVAGFYSHPDLHYRIARPTGGDSGWKLIRVKGADLAFRQATPEAGHRPAMMVLISECGRGTDNPSVMARQLLIGVRDRALRQAGPLAHRGSPGWMQVFDTIHEGVAVRVKTISIRNQGCTFDWALVAPGPFRPAEGQFDAWWSSFERDSPDTPDP